MADDTPHGGDREPRSGDAPSSDEVALSVRLQRLDQQLSELRKDREGQAKQSEHESRNQSASASAMARGFRLSSELVGGVIVGSIIGWSIDRWLSTSPWGLMVFLMLGFAAGVLNVMRAAGVAQNGGTGDRDPR
jgi:ATP synthase protein I